MSALYLLLAGLGFIATRVEYRALVHRMKSTPALWKAVKK